MRSGHCPRDCFNGAGPEGPEIVATGCYITIMNRLCQLILTAAAITACTPVEPVEPRAPVAHSSPSPRRSPAPAPESEPEPEPYWAQPAPPPKPGPRCAELAEHRRELSEAIEKSDQPDPSCKPATKTPMELAPDGTRIYGGSEGAWDCGGHIVTTQTNGTTLALIGRLASVVRDMKREHCE